MNTTSPKKLVFIDIEETIAKGVNDSKSEIIEICSSTLKGDLIINENRTLVKPAQTVITQELTDRTGLMQSDFCSAIPFKTACNNLKLLTSNQVAVVWDSKVPARFEKLCNKNYLKNPLPKQVLNLSAMFTALFPFDEYPTLLSAAQALEINTTNLDLSSTSNRVAHMINLIKEM